MAVLDEHPGDRELGGRLDRIDQLADIGDVLEPGDPLGDAPHVEAADQPVGGNDARAIRFGLRPHVLGDQHVVRADHAAGRELRMHQVEAG